MSRPVGAHFHVAHGWSNAVLLPEVTRYSIPGAVRRYATVARTVGAATVKDSDESAARALVVYLEQLNRDLDVGRLRDAAKVDEATFEFKLPVMAQAALASGSPQNNPVVPTAEEIIGLYRRAW